MTTKRGAAKKLPAKKGAAKKAPGTKVVKQDGMAYPTSYMNRIMHEIHNIHIESSTLEEVKSALVYIHNVLDKICLHVGKPR